MAVQVQVLRPSLLDGTLKPLGTDERLNRLADTFPPPHGWTKLAEYSNRGWLVRDDLSKAFAIFYPHRGLRAVATRKALTALAAHRMMA